MDFWRVISCHLFSFSMLRAANKLSAFGSSGFWSFGNNAALSGASFWTFSLFKFQLPPTIDDQCTIEDNERRSIWSWNGTCVWIKIIFNLACSIYLTCLSSRPCDECIVCWELDGSAGLIVLSLCWYKNMHKIYFLYYNPDMMYYLLHYHKVTIIVLVIVLL